MQNFGIYIHIPFCQRKCKYCDFVSFDKCDENTKMKYIECLIKEITCKDTGDRILNKNDMNALISNEILIITTIYIGGGTPSVLPVEYIEQILQAINYNFVVYENAEITIEVNPSTIDYEKLKKYKEIGINRLSICHQATHNRLLEMLGRINRYEDLCQAFENARKAGFDNINVDLMLGLPSQSMQELEDSVKKVIDLNPEHISIYSLILEEGTELEKLVESKELKMIPEDLERKMYWKTKKLLQKNGYKHYEISNFAKEGCESRHNLACWKQDEYIGFGLGAHSYLNKTRFSNTDNLDEYIKNIENNEFDKNVILQEKEQTYEEQAKEYMMLNLRKIDGASISKFEQKFQINPLFYFRFEISKLQEEGLIEVDLDNIRLTKKGLDFANLVFKEFV